MTTVFVHGVPETAAIWDPLLSELALDDAVTLSPPGFGAPVPAGFEATSDGYRDWLVAELAAIVADRGHPVDVVGHDWGGMHVVRAATVRPELVRRLVTDIAGTADPRYVWHDLAQVWQTPDAGEEFTAAVAAMPVEQRVETLVGAGMTEAGARACAEANGAEMGACILKLYRSAVQPNMTLWGDQFAETQGRPETLVIVAHDDHYTGGADMARRVAQRWDARVAELPGGSVRFEGTVSGAYLTDRADFAAPDDPTGGFSIAGHRSLAPRRWRLADSSDATIATFRTSWFGRGRTRVELVDGPTLRLEPVDRLARDTAKSMVLADTSRFVLRDGDRKVAATVPPSVPRPGIRDTVTRALSRRGTNEEFRPCAALVVDLEEPPDERVVAAVLLILREVVVRLRTP